MNRLLFVLVLIVAAVVGLGFYRNWFQIGTDSADGKAHINLTVDQKKIQEDEKKAEDRVRGTNRP